LTPLKTQLSTNILLTARESIIKWNRGSEM